MRGLAKRGGFLLVVVGLIAVAWALYARTRPRTPADDAPALFAKARPYLEELVGPLPFEPEFQSITREQLARFAHPAAETYLRLRFPHLQGEELVRAAVATRCAFAQAALAARAPDSCVIRIVADERVDPDLLTLAVVHEIAGAALDRKGFSAVDIEQFLAMQALIEGRALDITTKIARRLGSERKVLEFTERLLQVPDNHLDPGLRTVTQAALRQRHWAMTQGREFVRYLAEQKIDAGLIAARPPRQIEWIKQPQKYVRALRDNTNDLRDLLARVEAALGSPWMPFHQAWTADMVLQVAGLVNERPRAERSVSQWQEGRTLVWSRKDNPHQHVAVSIARFSKPSDARSYFNFAVELQRKQDVATAESCGLPFVVVESKSKSYPHASVEEAVINSRLLRPKNGQATTPANTLLARREDSVVEITWHGAPADLDVARNVISTIFAK